MRLGRLGAGRGAGPVQVLDWGLLLRLEGEGRVYRLRSEEDVCAMGPKGRETFVSPTDETVPLEEEKPLPPPRFDEKSVQRAQPAVPLTLRSRARTWPLTVIVLCVLGGVVGGVLGGIALTFYQRGAPGAEPQTQAEKQQPNGAGAATNANAAADTNTATDTAVATDAGAQPAAAQPAEAAPAAAPPEDQARAAGGERAQVEPAGATPEAGTEADVSTQGELRAALGEWLAATNSRDVGRQMSFYAPTVEAFYLSRNAPREAVRAEKARLFAQAASVNVEAAPPEIRLSSDGRTAVMRFRKRYQITGGPGSRSGEVLQELRWRRTGGGWKMVGERDLRVLQ